VRTHLRRILALLFAAACAAAAAQAGTVTAGSPTAENIGTDTAQQKLKEVSISKFEDAGFWYASMPLDEGVIQLRRFSGSPQEKQPIPDEKTIGITENDLYVLGAKITFYKRGMSSFSVYPIRPLVVEGVCKTLSVWVVGRNTKHLLKVLISDQFGHEAEVTMGYLNFTGWKKITVAIPPTIIQKDYHYNNRMGIKIEGFRIECDPMEAYGMYYIYFDDLRAVTDLFGEESRDVDDMADNW
jgi:hypothetical protein